MSRRKTKPDTGAHSLTYGVACPPPPRADNDDDEADFAAKRQEAYDTAIDWTLRGPPDFKCKCKCKCKCK
jgi:hypothetical protein